MRSNAWTTVNEFEFLTEWIPQFRAQQDIRVVGPWLAGVSAAFLTEFPSRSAQFERDRLIKVCFPPLVASQPFQFTPSRNCGRGMGTTPETLLRGRTPAMFSTSLARPTADPSPYSNLKHTLRSITLKGPLFTLKYRISMRCTSPATLLPSHPSSNSLRGPSTTIPMSRPPPTTTLMS